MMGFTYPPFCAGFWLFPRQAFKILFAEEVELLDLNRYFILGAERSCGMLEVLWPSLAKWMLSETLEFRS
ncbi:hypothetical protein PRUPE_7G249800 [Prunus persica]|uniref:Uncharacterized protein n=1 Tax=Prunus persica TaxID=3760 RepID=A0A251NIH7_PRUPE|nr:hypothetical protein PRUPE_7G249800 [Prunus persica]